MAFPHLGWRLSPRGLEALFQAVEPVLFAERTRQTPVTVIAVPIRPPAQTCFHMRDCSKTSSLSRAGVR